MAGMPVYLIDYSLFNAPDELRVSFDETQAAAWRWKACTKEKHEFVSKIFRASGISLTRTAVPACLQPTLTAEPKTDMDSAAQEARMVIGQIVADVLDKTSLSPRDIDILITNCSIFCPTPSLASMVVNMFSMREDVEAYNLGGMGCAMGVVGLSMVRDMLIAHPGKTCLFVSTEVITAAFYPGTRQEALVTNALFRMGGSAAVLTNNPRARSRAKYELKHCLRVHTGQQDRAYNALSWCPDSEGINGMVITKALPSEAAKVLDKGVRKMTPRIMTWGQYAAAAAHYAQAAAAYVSNGALCAAPAGPFQPDYTKCADHFLLHAGGYAILRGIQKGLRLPASSMLPSFASLRDFGNTSSASTWYTWSYIESTGAGIKRGDRVLQVGVGGGMKSGVAFWVALRSFKEIHPCWAHLGGRALQESDLPRPISTHYKSVFDLPNTGTAAAGAGSAPQQQQQQEEKAEKDKASAATSNNSGAGTVLDVEQTVKLLAKSLAADAQAAATATGGSIGASWPEN